MRQWVTMAALGATALTGCSPRSTGPRTTDPGTLLLQKAEAAASATDYEGLMQSETDSPAGRRTMEIMCYFRKPGMSRYEYRTGPARGLIVAQGDTVDWRYQPSLKHLVLSTGPVRSDTSRLLLIEQNYRTVVYEHRKVAGRDADEVDVLPKRSRSPWRRFWIDTRTY
ncbi:MAG: hypothetical protein LC772_08455, partial [Chloroflexi bacterium]|nr:hypothetical protein [Chloroflexota bacterium]